MNKCKPFGMKSLPVEMFEFGLHALRELAQLCLKSPAIERIADQRMPKMGHVHADLVRASGLESALDKRGNGSVLVVAIGLHEAPKGHGVTPFVRPHNRHLGPARGVAPERRLDTTVRSRRRAPDERAVAALHLTGAAMIGELRGERAVRLIGLGHDHQPARILVETVHDACLLYTS